MLKSNDSISSVSPAFIGDAVFFQDNEAAEEQKASSTTTATGNDGGFEEFPFGNFDAFGSVPFDDSKIDGVALPAKFVAAPATTMLHEEKPPCHSHSQNKKRSAHDFAAELFANNDCTPPTKLSRTRAIFILPQDTIHEDKVSADGGLVGPSATVGKDTKEAMEEDETLCSYAFYVPPSAPRKARRESQPMEDAEMIETPSKKVGGLLRDYDDDAFISAELGFGKMSLEDYESPLVAQWKKENRASAMTGVTATMTTTTVRAPSFLKAPRFYTMTTKTPPTMTATSTLKAMTTKSPPTVAVTSKLKVPASYTGAKNEPLLQEPTLRRASSKRVTWLYPNGVPDDSIASHMTDPKAAKETTKKQALLTEKKNKRASRLFPNGIPDDSIIVQPIPMRATGPIQQKSLALDNSDANTTWRPFVSYQNSAEKEFYEALPEVRFRPQCRRLTYPFSGSLPSEKTVEMDIDLNGLSLFLPRGTPKLYPSLKGIHSPSKGSDTEMAQAHTPGKTIPVFGVRSHQNLVNKYDVLQETSAFAHVAPKRSPSLPDVAFGAFSHGI